MPSRTDLSGEVFGLLTVLLRLTDGASPSGHAYARYWCVCSCGGQAVVRGTQLTRGNTRSCGCLALAHTVAMGYANRSQTVGYYGAHQRIRRARGPATRYACIDCGGSARHWSLRHTAPADGVNAKGHPFSGDPASYDPRCVSCHKKYDLSHAA